jgi:hypothetical protein
VVIEPLFDLGGELVSLAQQVAQAVCQSGQDRLSGGGAGHHDGLLVQRGQDLLDQACTHAWCAGFSDLDELGAAGGAQPGRAATARQQLQHRRVLHLRAQDAFQRRVDLGEQAADAVADAGDFAGEVVVVADQHLQLGQSLVAGIDAAQGVRQGAGSVCDDVGVAGVGLGGAGMQVGQAAHGQPGQVSHLMPAGAGDRDRQRTDRGGLVDHDEDATVAGQLGEQGPKSGFGVGQLRVVQPSAVRGQPDRMVAVLADVQAQKDAEPLVHASPAHTAAPASVAGQSVGLPAATLRRDQPQVGRPGPYQRSADATRPGDNTPRIMHTTGAVSHTGPGDRGVPGWGRSKR